MAHKASEEFSLRPLGAGDIDRIADWFLDFEDVAIYESGMPIPLSPESLAARWEPALKYADPPRALWFAAVDESDMPAAICALESINYFHGNAVVPIFVGKKMRGKGLAIAMSAAIMELAFDTLRLHRLTTFYREDNHATRVIVEKLGFQTEGKIREAWFSEGTFKDVVQVGLLRSEWVTTRENVSGILDKAGMRPLNLRRAQT